MRNNGSSEHHQNNNLKVVIAFGNFIGKDNSFYDLNKKEQIIFKMNLTLYNRPYLKVFF
jgi:integrase/recombinase XerD